MCTCVNYFLFCPTQAVQRDKLSKLANFMSNVLQHRAGTLCDFFVCVCISMCAFYLFTFCCSSLCFFFFVCFLLLIFCVLISFVTFSIRLIFVAMLSLFFTFFLFLYTFCTRYIFHSDSAQFFVHF